jgi:hypothetical protein
MKNIDALRSLYSAAAVIWMTNANVFPTWDDLQEALLAAKKVLTQPAAKPEQMNINTDGLRIGGKMWVGDRGWFVIARMVPGSVWVLPDTLWVEPGRKL